VPQPSADQQRAAEFAAALAAYQARTAVLRTQVEAYVRRLWSSLGSYRNADMTRFVQQVLPFVAGAQQTMTALTVANLARQAEIALGTAVKPAAVDVKKTTGSAARNGAAMAAVYGRPFHLVWRLLDELPREPGMVDQAIQAGADRAVDLALDDQQLAKQHTALEVLGQDDKVVGYRRVLEGPHSCGLCIVSATQRYHKEQLLAIHGGCDCSVAAIWGDSDPGQTIAATARVDGRLVPVADLPDVHERIEQRFGRSGSSARIIPGARDANGRILKYRDVLVTHDHGELGPVLAVKGHPFLGPTDL
jgi:hypothetical protein